MKQNNKITAFILAAGLGSRLKELTINKPKALIEINGRTLLETTIDNLVNQGFNHFVINIHHHADKIIDFLKQEKFSKLDIDISDESDMLFDTGGAILKALPYFNNSKAVLIHNVDIITDINLKYIYEEFCISENAAILLTQNRNNKRKLVFDIEDNFLGRYNMETDKYDGYGAIKSNYKLLSFSGIHLIKPDYFNNFDLKPCYVFDLYKELSRNYHVKSCFIQPQYWFDLGTQEQLKEASSWLLSQK